VGLKSLKSPNLTNGYPNKNKNNNKVKSKPLELRSRVKNSLGIFALKRGSVGLLIYTKAKVRYVDKQVIVHDKTRRVTVCLLTRFATRWH
jgi:hypothetical protein